MADEQESYIKYECYVSKESHVYVISGDQESKLTTNTCTLTNHVNSQHVSNFMCCCTSRSIKSAFDCLYVYERRKEQKKEKVKVCLCWRGAWGGWLRRL